MRKLKYVALLLLAGCSTTPSFNSLVQTAATLNDTAVNTADTALKTGEITSAQATAVLKVTDEVQAALVAANTAYAAGNQATATAKITAISTALSNVEMCLTGPKVYLSVCLQSIGAP